ncbi:hypothetical protein Tco_0294611, partial [Tanacetum coccineum]
MGLLMERVVRIIPRTYNKRNKVDGEHDVGNRAILACRLKLGDNGAPETPLSLTVVINAKGKLKTFHSICDYLKMAPPPVPPFRPNKENGVTGCGSDDSPKISKICFYYNTKGNWKRSCLKYLKDLKDEKGLKESRKLKHGELNLVMGNKKIMLVTRIGKYELMLKSGVRIDLNNCCSSSEVTRNIISFHALFKDGYTFSFDNVNGDILVYSNGCFMFKTSPYKGIYETVECISHNGNVILNVARRGVFLEGEMISKEESGSKKDLEEIQESANEEPIVNTDTQPDMVTPVKPDDISLPICKKSGRVSKPFQFYCGFHIDKDKISDST